MHWYLPFIPLLWCTSKLLPQARPCRINTVPTPQQEVAKLKSGSVKPRGGGDNDNADGDADGGDGDAADVANRSQRLGPASSRGSRSKTNALRQANSGEGWARIVPDDAQTDQHQREAAAKRAAKKVKLVEKIRQCMCLARSSTPYP